MRGGEGIKRCPQRGRETVNGSNAFEIQTLTLPLYLNPLFPPGKETLALSLQFPVASLLFFCFLPIPSVEQFRNSGFRCPNRSYGKETSPNHRGELFMASTHPMKPFRVNHELLIDVQNEEIMATLRRFNDYERRLSFIFITRTSITGKKRSYFRSSENRHESEDREDPSAGP